MHFEGVCVCVCWLGGCGCQLEVLETDILQLRLVARARVCVGVTSSNGSSVPLTGTQYRDSGRLLIKVSVSVHVMRVASLHKAE